MLSENIKALRKTEGLSQEALAARIHVVRQTVSKWETGLSVPEAEDDDVTALAAKKSVWQPENRLIPGRFFVCDCSFSPHLL